MGEIVPFRYDAAALSVEFKASDSPFLSRPHLKSIYNAWWRGAKIDTYGRLWICSSELHNILRTTKANVRDFLLGVNDRYQQEIAGKTYIQGSEIYRILDRNIQSAGSIKKENYLRFSEDVYQSFRDSDKLIALRAEYYEFIRTNKTRLKKQRIQELKLSYDELTNQPLIPGSEFSHIRSVSLHLHLADRYWNGLIVNKATHKIITRKNIGNEEELYDLCLEMKWSTEWYETFLSSLRSVES